MHVFSYTGYNIRTKLLCIFRKVCTWQGMWSLKSGLNPYISQHRYRKTICAATETIPCVSIWQRFWLVFTPYQVNKRPNKEHPRIVCLNGHFVATITKPYLREPRDFQVSTKKSVLLVHMLRGTTND